MKMLSLILLISLTLMQCQENLKEIHLIPEGYIGRVNIIYNVPGGNEKKYENSYRIYKIPENGILKTQFKLKEGVYDRNKDVLFYYVDKQGNRKQIYALANDERAKNDSINAFSFVVGSKGFKDCDIQIEHMKEYIIDKPSNAANYKPFDIKCTDLN